MIKTLALSALFALLPSASLATSGADKAAAVHDAITALDRINILKDDSDFVFNFADPNNKATKGAGGSLIAANGANFPALIGNGLALTIGQLEPCSINSPHTHPRATEMLLMTKGTISAGFLAENGARFVVNNVPELSATVFPAGSIHFQANYGCHPAQFVAALSDEDPGTIQIAQRFFGLPPDIVGASLGGLGVEEVAHLAALIPDNVIAATNECFARCGLQPPATQPTSQQQTRVAGNAFPSNLPSWTAPSAPGKTGYLTGKPSHQPRKWNVAVGADNQLKYSPETVSAAVGDIVTFHFVSKNHTVTRSSFNSPCAPLGGADGFDSGFHFVDPAAKNYDTFDVTVRDEKPIWVYCRQGPPSHCGQGMVFAVNAPATGNTFDAFKQKALATATTTTSPWPAPSGKPDYPTGKPEHQPRKWDVVVGADNQLKYYPETLSAAVGDKVTFHFVSKNHTVTRSSFNSPCSALGGADGFDSGFHPVDPAAKNYDTFDVTVRDEKPIWVYCRQGPPSHCGQGMVFAVNAPATGNTFDAFKQKALATGGAATTTSPWPAPPSKTDYPTGKQPRSWDVVVGADNQLKYYPETLSAAVGDKVTFHFVSKNHTVTRSSFNSPCAPLGGADGFDSGFHPVDPAAKNYDTFDITVRDEKPIWVYCRQGPPSHCGQGMVFAVNAPASGNTFDAFKQKALATGGSTTTTSPWPAPSAPSKSKVIDVAVGRDGQLVYEPADISANIGDIVRFTFTAKNHTVTQSSFEVPCGKLSYGFNSGFQPVPQGAYGDHLPQFNVTVTTDKPIWFYCQQTGHCEKGMVGAINAPKSGNTLTAFRLRAQSSD